MNNQNHTDMKPKIKNIESVKVEIEFDSPNDIRQLASQKDFVIFIYENILDKIEKAIKQKLKRIELIEITNLFYIVEIEKKQYKDVLNKILLHYEGLEDYNMCIKISDLIKKV
jgi:hypothetical protein